MRRSVALGAPLNLLLIGSGFSWLAMASPAAAASPNPTTGSLGVTVVANSVDSSSYPTVSVNLSIFDKATGRPERAPETVLGAGNVSLSPAGQVTSVSASTADIPAAYVLDLDTSGSMGEKGSPSMARAKALAQAFVAHLGANDYVRLLTFDVTTKASPDWLKGNDPALAANIGKVNWEVGKTNLTDAFQKAVYWASTGLPPTVDRREIVMITDANLADNDLPKRTKDVNDLHKSAPPIFVVGLLPLPSSAAGATMSGELSSLGTDTEGNYETADTTDAATQAPTLFQEAWASTKSTWQVTFSADPVPADAQVDKELTIHDAQGATGTATVTYNSAGLFTTTKLNLDLPDGATVTRDQTVTFSIGGYTTWKGGYQLQLFVDCDPRPQIAHCSPIGSPEVSGGQSGSLAWSMSVASLAQGVHIAYARLAVTYEGKQYFSTATLSFTRSGTTWNPGAVILTFGIGVAFIGAFFIAARRRSARRRQRRAL
jgi:hypothetical protein